MARLTPLFSGSSGNSYYIGSRSSGILIDAGRTAKQLEGMLAVCGIDPLAIQGVFVTHEHTDHISGLRVFARRYSLPVFTSAGTLSCLPDDIDGHVISGDIQLGGMTVSCFHTSHDAAEPLGFRVKTEDGRVVTLSTDLGYISDEVRESILGADMAVIESNHDIEMLRNGGYPVYLKERILSDRGHLSNAVCAAFLPEMLKSGCRRFLLAHLSRENNAPGIARDASLSALVRAGYVENEDFRLAVAAPENTDGRTFIF